MLEAADAHLASIDAELAPWCAREPFAEPVRRLGAYRGIDHPGALVLTAEVFDWRRFARAPSFADFVGLVPSEHSSDASRWRGPGQSRQPQDAIAELGYVPNRAASGWPVWRATATPSEHVRRPLVKAAWAYQHRPAVGIGLRQRQQGLPAEVLARSWKAQMRLCRRLGHLAAHQNIKSVVTAAVARELAGFVWAETTADLTA